MVVSLSWHAAGRCLRWLARVLTTPPGEPQPPRGMCVWEEGVWGGVEDVMIVIRVRVSYQKFLISRQVLYRARKATFFLSNFLSFFLFLLIYFFIFHFLSFWFSYFFSLSIISFLFYYFHVFLLLCFSPCFFFLFSDTFQGCCPVVLTAVVSLLSLLYDLHNGRRKTLEPVTLDKRRDLRLLCGGKLRQGSKLSSGDKLGQALAGLCIFHPSHKPDDLPPISSTW